MVQVHDPFVSFKGSKAMTGVLVVKNLNLDIAAGVPHDARSVWIGQNYLSDDACWI